MPRPGPQIVVPGLASTRSTVWRLRQWHPTRQGRIALARVVPILDFIPAHVHAGLKLLIIVKSWGVSLCFGRNLMSASFLFESIVSKKLRVRTWLMHLHLFYPFHNLSRSLATLLYESHHLDNRLPSWLPIASHQKARPSVMGA